MTENRYRRQNRSHRAPLDQLNALRELAGKISSYRKRYGRCDATGGRPTIMVSWSSSSARRSRYPSQTMTYCLACGESF